jgi:large subunit ribosomal protein L9
MKVILKEDVVNLGHLGDVVEVAPGYARNFLIPKKKALEATDKNLTAIEHQKKLLADQRKRERKEAEELVIRVDNTSITLPVQVGEEDKLFGSVTNKDISEALAKEGIQVDKHNILLEKPIKELGIFSVPIKIHPEVTANLKVWVVKA